MKIIEYPLIVAIIFFGLLISLGGRAQTDRNEAKVQMLKERIIRAEAKVARYEAKLARADSLITFGEKRVLEAEEEFARIEDEQKDLNKEYKVKQKEIRKQSKSKDEETASKVEDDMKALEVWFKTELKNYSDEIKMLRRQAIKAESDIGKGIDLEKKTIPALKDAQKSLEQAEEKYDSFIASLNEEGEE